MLRNPLTWLLLLIASTALGACCGSVECVCQDNLDDALFFRFNLDSTNADSMGFRSSQLRSVFIRRVLRDTTQPARVDTVVLTARANSVVQTVVINNTRPFVQSGTRKLDQYDYKIYLGRRREPTDSFLVREVQVKDEFVGDGCCSCNVNTRKELTLNGQYFDLTDPDGQDRSDTVALNRQR